MRGIDIVVETDGPGGFDQYGDPIASTASSRTVSGCLVAPQELPLTTERGREGETVLAQLVAPPGAAIERHDRIVVPSSEPTAGTYLVAEPVREWISAAGVNRGAVIALKAAAG